MEQTVINEMLARRLWRVLVDAGCLGAAPPDGDVTEDFVRQLQNNDRGEFRFQGDLGFGGKFYWHPTWGWRVACYKEDENPQRKLIVDTVNRRLKEMWADGEDL